MEGKVLHLQLDLRARNNVLLINLLSYSVVLTLFFMITRKFVFKLSIGLSPLPVQWQMKVYRDPLLKM